MLVALPCMAMAEKNSDTALEDEWAPVATWPFVYPQFQAATIFTNASQVVKAKANIHVGGCYAWYESNGQRLEVKQGLIKKIVFANGDVYYPIKGRVQVKLRTVLQDKLCRVLSEDTINGKVGRLYISEEVDRVRFDELVRANRMSMMTVGDMPAGFSSLQTNVSDSKAHDDVEGDPLPMKNRFYMLYEGDTFEALETEITKHLSKEEAKQYRIFERSSEIISGDRHSMENVWNVFFKSKNNK